MPGYAPALGLKARTLYQLGDFDGALSAYESLLALDPHVELLLFAADAARELHRADAAAKYLARAERLADTDPVPLSLYYARHGLHSERALRLIERQLREINPIKVDAAHALALWRVGRTDAARVASDRALRLGTVDAQLHLHRALIEIADGNVKAARERFDKALALNPKVDPLLVETFRRAIAQSKTRGSTKPLDHHPRDQYAFVRELASTRGIRGRAARDAALARLAAAWRNGRYEWEVRVTPQLCRSQSRCYAFPFDHARFDGLVVQGWLPRLEFETENELAAMQKACEPYTHCIVQVSGKLSQVQLSEELPTALSFSDVRFVHARAQGRKEAWVR